MAVAGLLCEWVGAKLELYQAALSASAAFHVPNSVFSVIGIDGATLPPGFRIVNSTIHTALEEAHRVGNSQRHKLAGGRHEREKGIRLIAGGDGNILAEAEGVELVDVDIAVLFVLAAAEI